MTPRPTAASVAPPTCQRGLVGILHVDGLEVQLHSGEGEDGLRLVVVAGGAAEAAQQAGALRRCAALLVVGLHIPQQVEL